MKTLGVHHVGLAVSDVQASAQFFTQCLGWTVAREIPSYPAIFAKNMRVSTFIYLYRRLVLGENDATARFPMSEVWEPNEVWGRFIRAAFESSRQ